MQFEAPWMLLGLVAAAIPIVIHLWHRRSAPDLPFAAIDFLLLSDKRLARRFRLRQILVLLARTLLIAAVPLALAKPYSESGSRLPLAWAIPSSVVIVVDDSASMSYRLDGERLFDRAVARSRGLLGELPPSHNVAVVAASRPARVVAGPLTFDRRSVLGALDELRASERATDITGALRLAEQLLAESHLPRRQVVLLTDLTVSGWPDLEPPWTGAYPPQLHVVDMAQGAPLPNVGIVGAEVHRPASRAAGELELHVTVRNGGETPWRELVTAQVKGRALKGYLEVPPAAEATKVFRLDAARLAEGHGTVRIPEDALALDDVRTFTLGRPAQVRVLVLNGAPRSVPYLDETFFLERALRPERRTATGVVPVTLDASELSAAQLDHADVVVLSNVGHLAPDQVSALEKFVRAGGGLFVTAGENLTREAATLLAPILPLGIRDVRNAGDVVGGGGVTYFAPPRRERQLFAPFGKAGDSTLYAAEVRRYVLLEPEPRPGTEVLLSYTDGSPALVEQRLGDGRVLMLTTTIDRDWSDLPIRTSYLPLVQQIVRTLGQHGEGRGPGAAAVGETVRIPLPRGVALVELRQPDGAVRVLERPAPGEGAPLVLEDLAQSGLYELRALAPAGARAVERRLLAVAPDPSELRLERIDAKAVQAAFTTPSAGMAPGVRTAEQRNEDARTRHWPWILLGLFALLGFETWLVVRG